MHFSSPTLVSDTGADVRPATPKSLIQYGVASINSLHAREVLGAEIGWMVGYISPEYLFGLLCRFKLA